VEEIDLDVNASDVSTLMEEEHQTIHNYLTEAVERHELVNILIK
jgi:hypothetical protein